MNRLLPIAGPLVVLLAWQLAFMSEAISIIILPSPASVAEAGLALLSGSGRLWGDMGITLGRMLLATALSALIGVPLGLVMGVFSRLYSALSFLIDFFRSIPPIALFPLFILVFGLSNAAMVAVPVYGCTLVLAVSSVYGVRNTPSIRRDVAKVLRMSPTRTFFTIVLPSALPQIASGLRVAISLAMVLTIVVEMLIGTSDGLGRRIYQYHISFDAPEMYFCIILVGAVGYLLNHAFVLVERRVIHWSDA